MKDVTSTSFGYVIAFLCPGLAALYALGLWSAKIAGILSTFLTSGSNLGLFLMIIVTALGLGVLVGIPRMYLFERRFYKGYRLQEKDYDLSSEAKLTAYRAAIDETYRYYQFYGGITVVLPFLYLGWLVHYWQETRLLIKLLSVLLFIVIEYGTAMGAKEAYDTYVRRARRILKDAAAEGEGGS